MIKSTSLKWIILFLQCILCLLIFDDFPITWDEETSRLGTGKANVEYILGIDGDSLLMNHEKYHGPAFEMLLYGAELISNLRKESDVYVLRHLLTHLVFILFAFQLFVFIQDHYKNDLLAILSVLILYLSPRFFADSFNNSKDLVYFCFYGLAIISALRWSQSKKLLPLLLFAFLSGFLLAIRLTGLVLLPLSFTLFYMVLCQSSIRNVLKSVFIKTVFMYFSVVIMVCIMFWPVLWDNPVKHILAAYNEMKKYGWGGEVLFRGQYYYANQIPFYYPIRWMMISTPVPYLLLFSFGVMLSIWKGITKFRESANDIFVLLSFLIPFTSIIIMKPVLYDGWRHLYFLYAPMVIILCLALEKIMHHIAKLNKTIITISVVAGTGYLLYSAYLMIHYHPIQNTYFNRLAGKNLSHARKMYDVDYWGTSTKDCLDYIVKTEAGDSITLLYDYDPVYLNVKLLSEHDQKRIQFKNREDKPMYRINLYRFRPENYSGYYPVYHVIRDGGIVSSVYKKSR